MKKVFSAVFCAFCTFCGMAAVGVSEGFESLQAGAALRTESGYPKDGGGAEIWSCDAAATDESVVAAHDGGGEWGRRRPDAFQSAANPNGNYLAFSVKDGALWRDASGADTMQDGGKFHLDTMMRFETGDVATLAEAAGSKFGLWMRKDADGSCSLVAYCGRLDVSGGAVVLADVAMADVERNRFHKPLAGGEWYRVTVRRKFVAAGGRTIGGFELYVDGLLFRLAEPPCGADALAAVKTMAGHEELAAALESRAFIPSAADNAEPVTKVGFLGYGAVDDIAGVADAKPGFLPGGGNAVAVNGLAYAAGETAEALAEVKSVLEEGRPAEVRMLQADTAVDWSAYGGKVAVADELSICGESSVHTALQISAGGGAKVSIGNATIAGASSVEVPEGALGSVEISISDCRIDVPQTGAAFVDVKSADATVHLALTANKFDAVRIAGANGNLVIDETDNNNGWTEDAETQDGCVLTRISPVSGEAECPAGAETDPEAFCDTVTAMFGVEQSALVRSAISKAAGGAEMSADEQAVVNRILLNDPAATADEKIRLGYVVDAEGKWNFAMTREDGSQLVKGADTVKYGWLQVERAASLLGEWTREMRVTEPEGTENKTAAAPDGESGFYRAKFYWNEPSGGAQE